MRTVSAPTQAQAAGGVTQPCYLIQIAWQSLTTYHCTHSTQSWNGQTWVGSGITVSDFTDTGIPGRVVLSDTDNAFRTLVLVGGIRDRRISIWKAYVGAMAVGDPVEIFFGYGDSARITNGRVAITLGAQVSRKVFSPRERIGPTIGVNFTATPGTKVSWNGQVLIMVAAT